MVENVDYGWEQSSLIEEGNTDLREPAPVDDIIAGVDKHTLNDNYETQRKSILVENTILT